MNLIKIGRVKVSLIAKEINLKCRRYIVSLVTVTPNLSEVK